MALMVHLIPYGWLRQPQIEEVRESIRPCSTVLVDQTIPLGLSYEELDRHSSRASSFLNTVSSSPTGNGLLDHPFLPGISLHTILEPKNGIHERIRECAPPLLHYGSLCQILKGVGKQVRLETEDMTPEEFDHLMGLRGRIADARTGFCEAVASGDRKRILDAYEKDDESFKAYFAFRDERLQKLAGDDCAVLAGFSAERPASPQELYVGLPAPDPVKRPEDTMKGVFAELTLAYGIARRVDPFSPAEAYQYLCSVPETFRRGNYEKLWERLEVRSSACARSFLDQAQKVYAYSLNRGYIDEAQLSPTGAVKKEFKRLFHHTMPFPVR